jgi:nitronate monooxygenase
MPAARMLTKLPDRAIMPVARLQTPALPMFSPIAPTVGMPDSAVDRTALYAGETVEDDIRHIGTPGRD